MPPFFDKALKPVVVDCYHPSESFSQDWVINAVEAARVGYWEYNVATQEVRVNLGWLTQLGFAPQDPQGAAAQWHNLLHPDDLPVASRAFQRHLTGETPDYAAEYRIKHVAGHWVWVLSRGRIIQRNANGAPLRVAGINLDITARKRLEEQLAERERQLHALYEFSPVAMARANLRGELLDLNRAFCDLLGYSRKELMVKHWHEYTHPDDIEPELELAQRALRGEFDRYSYDKRYLHRSGRVIWVHMEVRRIQDWVRDEDVFLHVIHDISARKQTELEYWQLANTDSLTQIPNRRRFLEAAGEQLRRPSGSSSSLLLLDLDHFKLVNDRYGHGLGDAALRTFSAAIAEAIPPSSLFGRLGGEEFAILVHGLDRSALETLADRLIDTVRRIRLQHEGQTVTLTTSIGVAHQATGKEESLAMLLHDADGALYRAKAKGRDCWVMASTAAAQAGSEP